MGIVVARGRYAGPQDISNDETPYPNVVGTVGDAYPDMALYPGYLGLGLEHRQADIRGGDWATPEAYSWGMSRDLTTDPQYGGTPGGTDAQPYGMGVAESNTVEDFELRGRIIKVPVALAAYNSGGPVGTMDYTSSLALGLAQEEWSAPDPDASAWSIVQGV